MIKKLMLIFICVLLFGFLSSCDNTQETQPIDVAQVVIDYENELKEKAIQLQKENPGYFYYPNDVVSVCCHYILNEEISTNEIIEKYDMRNVFSNGLLHELELSGIIMVEFKRDDFTQSIYESHELIKNDQNIKSASCLPGTAYDKSYMPNIDYYVKNPRKVNYELLPYNFNVHEHNGLIINSMDEYEQFLDGLLEMSKYNFEIETINHYRTFFNETFFEDNSLIISKVVVRGSGSVKLTFNNLYISNGKAYLVVRTDSPSGGTCDMQFKSFTLKVKKSDIANVNEVITLE